MSECGERMHMHVFKYYSIKNNYISADNEYLMPCCAVLNGVPYLVNYFGAIKLRCLPFRRLLVISLVNFITSV